MINVKHIAKLARLGITEQEEEKFQKELSSILDYVGELNKIDTEGVEPMSGGTDLINVFREDEAEKKTPERKLLEKEKLLVQAPETKDGYVKVKAIL